MLENVCGTIEKRSIEKLHKKGEEKWGSVKVPIHITRDRSVPGFNIVGSFVFSFSPADKLNKSPRYKNGESQKSGAIVFEFSSSAKL